MSSFHYERSYCGPLQAVIFDWAGTVLDYGSRAPVLAVMKAFERCDVPISLAQARAPMGKAKREHIQAILQMPEVAECWQQVHGSPGDAAVDRVFEQFLPLQKEILPECATLIPGSLETISYCRRKQIKIGSSTGYTQELMDILVPLANEQGYRPDAIVCASDVSPGRPAPWMCWENARRLNVYPPAAIVKVDDTEVGIEAGLNAGMWTTGISETGNLVGLSQSEIEKLEPAARQQIRKQATEVLAKCGAHYVIDSIAQLPQVLERIEEKLRT